MISQDTITEALAADNRFSMMTRAIRIAGLDTGTFRKRTVYGLCTDR